MEEAAFESYVENALSGFKGLIKFFPKMNTFFTLTSVCLNGFCHYETSSNAATIPFREDQVTLKI
jgi:hypothetical protein